MTSADDETLAGHLHKLRLRSGLSLGKLAGLAGYAGRSSIQRYFSDQSIETISLDTARDFSRALYGRGSPPIEVIDLAPLLDFKNKSMSLSVAAELLRIPSPGTLTPTSAKPAQSGMLPIMGTAHASNWMENSPSFEGEPAGWLTIPFQSGDPPPGQYALRIVGASVNLQAPEGHYAICERFSGTLEEAPADKFVHVERCRGGFFEWAVRRVRWQASGLALWPESDHADHQSPVDLTEQGVTVRVLGVVTGWYRPA